MKERRERLMARLGRLTAFQRIVLGFAGVILLGGVLLTLPPAAADGRWTPFPDALFTSVSAVCVTGLVVTDTATHWSGFGQAILLLLIQIGGLGVLTVAAAVSRFTGQRITLGQRSAMREAMAAPKLGGIDGFIGFAVRVTLLAELTGTVLLLPVFLPEFGLRGLWMALFHAVSAFCNAGFDLMGSREAFSSLTAYRATCSVNLVIMALIIFGGIGFAAWEDVKTHRLRLRRYRMQTKVVLTMAAVLILVPATCFFFLEFRDLPAGERILASLFQSVTTRTAGFNTADLGKISGAARGAMILLMLVGGAPGSTAGGMKTTTLAVLLASTLSVFRRREDVRFFGRRVEQGTVRTAAAVGMLDLTLFFGGAILISLAEGLPMDCCLFETASAVGTVGLSLGLTPTLGGFSRAILMILMFLGRVGGLTMIYAAGSGPDRTPARLPVEQITVG